MWCSANLIRSLSILPVLFPWYETTLRRFRPYIQHQHVFHKRGKSELYWTISNWANSTGERLTLPTPYHIPYLNRGPGCLLRKMLGKSWSWDHVYFGPKKECCMTEHWISMGLILGEPWIFESPTQCSYRFSRAELSQLRLLVKCIMQITSVLCR